MRTPWLLRSLIALVALAPLPLGGNRSLPAALLALGAALLLSLWAISVLRGAALAISPARLRWPLICFALTCVWILVQWLPLGFGDPLWQIAADETGKALPARLSVNPDETLSALMRLLTYGAVFWLSLQSARHPHHAEVGLKAVAAIGAAYAVYGLAIFLSGNNWLLIYPKWAYPASLTSTFVNRNSYASFAGLCLLAAAALLLARIRHTLSLNWPLRRRVARLVEQLILQSGWLTAAFLVSLTALMLTGSRAGIASSAAGLICLALFFLRGRAIGARSLAALLVAVALIGGLAYALGAQTLKQRYDAPDLVEASGHMRLEGLSFALSAIASAPLTGTGYGTFTDVITAYRTISIPSLIQWDKAHNTYLENAVELGIPAAATLNLAILLLALRCLSGVFTRQRGWLLPATGIAATLLVALHALVDFSLQIPAVAILYAFLMGLAVAQSWRQEQSAEQS
jgi:O-antigen ligase